MEIVGRNASELIEQGMLEYGQHTVEQRAVPDFRDGLKPVHRRILYAMYTLGVLPNKGLKKSAAVVGETLAKYHPHSDMSVFSTLVNLVHERYPLVFGSGNWGDEYSAAAGARYIDCRLTNVAMSLFEYADVARYVDNYSGEVKEPLVLPSKCPLLLMNGTSGIAVGVSVEIPPHNLKELVEALIYLVQNPEASTEDLLHFIQGPDYELGGVLVSSEKELLKVYESGRGSLTFRCQYRLTEIRGKKVLEVFNYCPRFDQDGFIHKCEDFVEKGLLDYVSNDSAEGVFKLSVGYSNASIVEEKVLPLLYQTVSYRFYVTERLDIDDVSFRSSDLKTLMLDWLEYQRSIRVDYYNYVLENLRIDMIKRATRLLATQHVDKVAEALKTKEALEHLIRELKISKERARYILTLQVGSLMRVSAADQKKELHEVQAEIATYNDRLSNLDREIIKDLQALSVFFDERRTLVRELPPILETDNGLWVAYGSKGVKQVPDYTKIRNAYTACLAAKGLYTIDEGGTILKWRVLEEIKPYPNTFEYISGDYQYICVLDAEGSIAILDLSKVRRKECVALVTKTKLISAVGFNDTDTLIFSNKKRKAVEIRTIDNLTICRTSTRGFKLDLANPVRVEALAPTDVILDSEAKQISLEDVKQGRRWYLLGEYNLCGGRVVSQQEALDTREWLRLEANVPEIRKLR